MFKKNKWQLIMSSLVILLPVLIGLFLEQSIPGQLVPHWDANGTPDRWGGRGFVFFGIPVIFFVAHWLCAFVTLHDPKNEEQSIKVFHMVLWILPVVSLVVCGFTYAIALGNDIHMDMVTRVLFGVMFVIFGNYMPKCKQNQTIGIKVIWTLRNEENWNKTHRFTGKLWVAGGLLFLVTLFIPVENLMFVVFPILVLAIMPMIYSYAYYRKQLIAGTATKEDAVLSPSDKKTMRVSIAIGIIVCAFALLFLFTGKFEVTFGETALTIDAVYWDDMKIAYADISDVEYREQDDPNASGNRTFGYGSFTLLMGQFKNSEFGMYTRYSYTSCDACVVISMNDDIVIINGKDTEQTKAIYDELCKQVSK